ncbi:hypothetical protein [Knoellia subterranea]|uniref:Uncharacterized protein n=1 Tax=Knoellia subterranea KCTC 19937 TaxID=1385521 RepID=A0A0A0JP36_9MICO|nr:hypothetical protein [Knoellia subterranea]KGN39185.1 hypothetical protein N803_01395 [Knoellia subterranea KCTC 19937]
MSAVVTELVLADSESLQDLGRYAARARALDADGAVRLQAVGPVLASWVCVLPGAGLMGTGTTLGLRTSALAEPAELDVVVPLAAVSDRVARPGERASLPVPPMNVTVPWAAVSPPRSGWEPVGVVTSEALQRTASDGIAEVASGTPDGAGAHAVAALRTQVWGRVLEATDGEPELPAALAFAAYALGFLTPGTQATLARSGRWTRLTTAAGHALTRT